MATYYSDRFSGTDPDTGLEDDAILDRQKRSDAGIGHGRLRYKRAQVTVNLTNTWDQVRLSQFRSSDRIVSVFITHTAAAGGMLVVGFAKTGISHDGGSVEGNIIANDMDVTSARNRVDLFGTGFPDADLYRGKPLWEMVAMAGAGSGDPAHETFTEDPMEDWDLTLKPGGSSPTATTNSATYILEVYYTAGD